MHKLPYSLAWHFENSLVSIKSLYHLSGTIEKVQELDRGDTLLSLPTVEILASSTLSKFKFKTVNSRVQEIAPSKLEYLKPFFLL